MKNNLLILIFLLTLTSCFEQSREVIITDFSKSHYDTLIPNQNVAIAPYSNAFMQVKGEVNDTIKIRFNHIEKKYTGAFEDVWDLDYYGEIDVPFEFDPFRAKKGKVSIHYKIH